MMRIRLLALALIVLFLALVAVMATGCCWKPKFIEGKPKLVRWLWYAGPGH